jgi:hypothetical protein
MDNTATITADLRIVPSFPMVLDPALKRRNPGSVAEPPRRLHQSF